MIRKIQDEEINKIYNENFCKDFPIEQRKGIDIKKFTYLIKNIWDELLYTENEEIKGYCMTRIENKHVLIVYFAVIEKYRGQGIGQKFMKELKEIYKENEVIILEVENPEKAKNNEEKEICKKRIKFYEKLDFKIIENLKYILYNVDYKIMELPINQKYQYEFEKFKNIIKNEFYSFIKEENNLIIDKK